MNRNLDGVYFRIKKETWEDICFSDLSVREMLSVMEGRDDTWKKSLCGILENSIQETLAAAGKKSRISNSLGEGIDLESRCVFLAFLLKDIGNSYNVICS